MKFKKWALNYVFTCAMVAHARKDKERFAWIIRTALQNWSSYWFIKLTNMLQKNGVII